MLDYELVPARQKDSRRLMVVLHGLGDSLEGYRWLPEELDFPWLNYLLVNAPDEYFTGFSWFDFPGDPFPGVRRSNVLLAELLDDRQKAGFPAAQMMMFGFSQGALMTWETGMRYPHLLAGLVAISGFIPQADNLFRERSLVALQQRFLATHGTLDPILPFAEAKNQVQYMQRSGVQVDWHEFAKVHTIDSGVELSVIRQFVAQCYSEPKA
jgi:phospholipase/carboxylesterase